MTQPKVKPKAKLTGDDYLRLTPPSHRGVRYQLIEGELIEMAGASRAHQRAIGGLYLSLQSAIEAGGIGELLMAPFDVHIDEHNTFQPDLLFVSAERQHILNERGAIGAPDLVVEVLSESTRRRDLEVKLPVYARNGVREMLAVDLDAETVAKYVGDGQAMTLERVYGPDDVLTSDVMPGVAIELGPIFARLRSTA